MTRFADMFYRYGPWIYFWGMMTVFVGGFSLFVYEGMQINAMMQAWRTVDPDGYCRPVEVLGITFIRVGCP